MIKLTTLAQNRSLKCKKTPFFTSNAKKTALKRKNGTLPAAPPLLLQQVKGEIKIEEVKWRGSFTFLLYHTPPKKSII